MKSLSAGMTTHLAQEVTTLAVCWKVTAVDTTVLGFTSHTSDLTVSSQLYKSSAGFTPSAVSGSATLSVDNLNVEGLLSADFALSDLLGGKWDFATVEIFMVNYLDLTIGTFKVRKGHLGVVTAGRQQFSAEIRGLLQAYSRSIVELYTPTCRADLGDTRCKVIIANYTFTGTVTSFTDKRVFHDSARTEANDYFTGGLLTWTGGLNNGRQMEVKAYLNAGGGFGLTQPMYFAIANGDTYSVYKGCNKVFDDATNGCKSFAGPNAEPTNVLNFRGEPHVPQRIDLAVAAGGAGGAASTPMPSTGL